MKRALLGLPLLAVLPALLLSSIAILGGDERQVRPTSAGYGDELNPAGIPQDVLPWITKAATQCETITAPVLAAQLKAESGFNPRAQSPAGAQGIAQFMPGTWPTWGQDSDGNGTATPFDVGDAIMAQGKFMCSLAKQVADYPGDRVDLALAAYNAGFGRIQQYSGIPPFAETRTYVKRIKGYVADFSAAVTGDVVLPIDPSSSYVSQNNWGGAGSRWARGHTGTDFSVACGTTVRAATGGRIQIDRDQAWSGPWLVKVSTGTGRLTTWYAHMQSINVQPGDHVVAGDPIGQVGTRGNSTGCHLHFEYHPRGGTIYEDNRDPIRWLTESAVKIR